MTVTDAEFITIMAKLPIEKDEAMKVAIYISEHGLTVAELDKIYLNKNDKLEIVGKIDALEIKLNNKLDSHFKWLAGLMVVLFGIALTIIKM